MSETTIKAIHQDLIELRFKVEKIEHIIEENYELSDWAKKQLKKARTEKKPISHKDIMKKYA